MATGGWWPLHQTTPVQAKFQKVPVDGRVRANGTRSVAAPWHVWRGAAWWAWRPAPFSGAAIWLTLGGPQRPRVYTCDSGWGPGLDPVFAHSLGTGQGIGSVHARGPCREDLPGVLLALEEEGAVHGSGDAQLPRRPGHRESSPGTSRHRGHRRTAASETPGSPVAARGR